jgi:prepilin peptidase CpaA
MIADIEPNIVIAVPLLSILALATLTDLREQRIPNGLSLGGAVLALITQATLFGPSGFALGAAGWALCLICFLPFYIGGGMAAGDVKLMAMVGAFLGPVAGFVAFLCTLGAGAVIGLLYMGVRAAHTRRCEGAGEPGADDPSAGRLAHMARTTAAIRAAGEGKIPYASAIAIGTAAAIWQPHQIIAAWSQGGWA